jgi:hypothetical protein
MARGKLKVGDRVSWNSSQGRVNGKVVRKQAGPTKIQTHKVAATPSEPQYIVESDKTRKRAAHKRKALRRTG